LKSWLKTILKYIALYFILLFIVNVIGYKSTIIIDIYNNFLVFGVYFLKLFSILNFLVVIYFILKLYLLIMFINNKEYINPEDYNKLIKSELIETKELAIKIYLSPEKQSNYYKHYLKLILLYSSISLSNIIVLVIIQ
jgi:hypothetical protein